MIIDWNTALLIDPEGDDVREVPIVLELIHYDFCSGRRTCKARFNASFCCCCPAERAKREDRRDYWGIAAIDLL